MASQKSSKPGKRLTNAVTAAKASALGARRKAATVAAGTLAVMMGYHVVFGHNGLTAYEHKRQDARFLQQQMRDLQAENARLRGHVDRLQNDPGAIEHEAREELHYTPPGEVIYTLPAEPASPHPTPSR